jgi:hypothetical protein
MLANPPKSVRSLRNQLLVEATDARQSRQLARLNNATLIDTQISVTPHKFLNTKQGLITAACLRDMPVDEIVINLASQGVTYVKHFDRRENDSWIPSNTYLLTFRDMFSLIIYG